MPHAAAGRTLIALAVLLAVPFLLSNELVQFAFDVFRVQEDTLGTRQLAWTAVVGNLSLVDWISGIGVGAGPGRELRSIHSPRLMKSGPERSRHISSARFEGRRGPARR